MLEIILVYGLVGSILGGYTSFAVSYVYRRFFQKNAAVIRGVGIVSVVWLGCVLMIILKHYESDSDNELLIFGYSILFISIINAFCMGYFFIFDGRKLEKEVKEQLGKNIRNNT